MSFPTQSEEKHIAWNLKRESLLTQLTNRSFKNSESYVSEFESFYCNIIRLYKEIPYVNWK
jgi:hypothetical protein